MDSVDLDLLASIASGGLGHWTDVNNGLVAYVKDDDCIGCLKDLQRIFRDEFRAHGEQGDRDAFFAVSKYNFARSDLVPLIVTYPEDFDIVYNSLKVCTLLTQTEDVTGDEAPQLEKMLQVCDAFVARDALAVIVSLLAEPLSRHPKMNERDTALAQLVIAFLKNLTTVAAGAAKLNISGAARVKAQLVQRMLEDNVLELLLLMAQHSRQKPFKSESHVLLEIFKHILTDLTAEQVVDVLAIGPEEPKPAKPANTGARRPVAPRGGLPRNIAAGIKAPTFSGAVYMRKHIDHSGSVLVRQSATKTQLPTLNPNANRKHAQASRNDNMNTAVFTPAGKGASNLPHSVAYQLAEFTLRFQKEGYAPLMSQVQKELQPGLTVSRLDEQDYANFLTLAQHCTRIVRLREERRLQKPAADQQQQTSNSTDESPFSCISTTLSWETIHMVRVLWVGIADTRHPDSIRFAGVPKEEREGMPDIRYHVPRVLNMIKWDLIHVVTPFIKELLMTLDLARVAGNSSDRQAASRVQQRLMHDDKKDTSLLSTITSQIKNYNYRYQPRAYAVDLVELLHIVLGMLDRLSGTGFQVEQTRRKYKRKPKSKEVTPAKAPAADGTVSTPPPPVGVGVEGVVEEQQQQQQPTVAADGEDTAMVAAPTETAAAPGEGGEEQGDAMVTETVALPTSTSSPAAKQAVDVEPTAAVDPTSEPVVAEEEAVAAPTPEVELINDDLEELEESDEESEGRQVIHEVTFDPTIRIRQECAQPYILHFYTWLLAGYRKNAPFTNYAIISMYKRVADTLNLEPMLYELSVLRVAHAILSDAGIKSNPQFAEIIQFCKRLTRNIMTRIVPEKYATAAASPQDAAAKKKVVDDVIVLDEDDDDEDNVVDEEIAAEKRKAKLLEERRTETKDLVTSSHLPGMMLCELLFWKTSNVAEQIRDDYNWEKAMRPEYKLGDPNADYGQLAFASYKEKKTTFTEEQCRQLREAFESCNGHKDCLDRLEDEFQGQFKKFHISKQLKAMGLYKGRLTGDQQERCRELYAEHKDRVDCMEVIADDLNAGFTSKQIKNLLKRIDLVATHGGSKKGTKNGKMTDWSDDEEEVGHSSDDDDDGASDGRNAEERFDALFGGASDDDEQPARRSASPAAPVRRAVDTNTEQPSPSPATSPLAPRSAPRTAGIESEKGTGSGAKRSRDKDAEDDGAVVAERKRSALEELRRRRLKLQDATVAPVEQPASQQKQAEPESVAVVEEPSPQMVQEDVEMEPAESPNENNDKAVNHKEEEAVVKKGRRLLKKKADAPAPEVMAMMEDLLDF